MVRDNNALFNRKVRENTMIFRRSHGNSLRSICRSPVKWALFLDHGPNYFWLSVYVFPLNKMQMFTGIGWMVTHLGHAKDQKVNEVFLQCREYKALVHHHARLRLLTNISCIAPRWHQHDLRLLLNVVTKEDFILPCFSHSITVKLQSQNK